MINPRAALHLPGPEGQRSRNLAAFMALFPEAVTEGSDGATVDVEALSDLIGAAPLADGDAVERFGLSWHGKRQARQLALSPTSATLIPDREASLDWDTTRNLMIEGDNLEVLKALQGSYAGRVKVISIDPPYNTGNDVIYADDFRDPIGSYLLKTGQRVDGAPVTSQVERHGRLHANWLSLMYPRLKLARSLLCDDGAIFVNIDDRELGHLLMIMTEIFGEENFQANISWQKRYTRSNNTTDFTTMVEHIVVFAKSDLFQVNLLERTREADARYANPDHDPRGPWKGASFLNPATPQQRPNLSYPLVNPHTGSVTHATSHAWRRSRAEFERLSEDGRLYWGASLDQSVPVVKMFLSEARKLTPVNFWDHDFAGDTDQGTLDCKELFGERIFDNPKPTRLIRRIIEHASDADSLILDFFAGSGTLGQAVMEQNAEDGGQRRFILVQLPVPLDDAAGAQHAGARFCAALGRPATIAEITKERLRRAARRIALTRTDRTADTGFRSFRLGASAFTVCRHAADGAGSELVDRVGSLTPGRRTDEVLHELILRHGMDLCAPLSSRILSGLEVWAAGPGDILACLEGSIALDQVPELAEGIVAWSQEIGRTRAPTCIFLDESFADDVAKTTLLAQFDEFGFPPVRIL
jgi:adenine-specific DNA-methyltransferase